MEVMFFASSDELRAWFAAHHESATELWVGFYKKGIGKASVTYPEAVDQALCFGWIDGVRRSLGAESYANRFTPRKQASIWSPANIKRVSELADLGLMRPAGMRIFERRDPESAMFYSDEVRNRPLAPEHEAEFRANVAAWAFFQAQSPSYRRTATFWVTSAKQEATRLRRLRILIAESAAGRRWAAG
ncbi:MAG TPA: YdeI/OmpD-associated family protein [Ktedonobacterales bacterium]|nr:YdeI/OmpD-associated family protein [Ktedonobacterales bacterium]